MVRAGEVREQCLLASPGSGRSPEPAPALESWGLPLHSEWEPQERLWLLQVLCVCRKLGETRAFIEQGPP